MSRRTDWMTDALEGQRDYSMMSGGARRSLRSSTAVCTTASLSLAATAAFVSFKFKDVVNNGSTSKNKEVKEDKSVKRTHAEVKTSSTSVKPSSLTNGTKASPSSSCSSRVDVKEETSSKTEDSSRPRRDAALRAIIPSAYLSNLTALKLKEEQDLKKAIKASLLEAKRNGVTSVSPTKQTSSTSNKTVKEETSDSSSVAKSSNSLNNNHHQNHLHHRKGRNPHPQRKFAHNSSNGSVSSSTSSLTQYRGLPSYHAPLIPTNEVYPAITPDTQDFVSFLCFRKMPAPVTLPDHLNMDKLNEAAMKEKNKKTEETKKITQEDRSSGKKRKKEVKEDDKTVTNNNTQKKEEKSDKKLRRH